MEVDITLAWYTGQTGVMPRFTALRKQLVLRIVWDIKTMNDETLAFIAVAQCFDPE